MRYIDAEKIKITADTMIADGECYVPLAAVKQAIAQAPTEDVKKVIHARWIRVKNFDLIPNYECSLCARQMQTFGDARRCAPYCYCGAKMDGKENEK